eukprot:365366-Chlamydomonas_euryale.AAC.16
MVHAHAAVPTAAVPNAPGELRLPASPQSTEMQRSASTVGNARTCAGARCGEMKDAAHPACCCAGAAQEVTFRAWQTRVGGAVRWRGSAAAPEPDARPLVVAAVEAIWTDSLHEGASSAVAPGDAWRPVGRHLH